MKKPEKKITPKDDAFDSADFDVPIEVEAYNNGFNECKDLYDKYDEEREVDVDKIEDIIDELNLHLCNEIAPSDVTIIATALAEALERGELWKS